MPNILKTTKTTASGTGRGSTDKVSRRSRRRTLLSLLAAFMAFALIAAACGNDDDDDDSSSDDTEQDDGSSNEAVTGGSEDDADESDADGPVYGGKLVYGVEADSANPWVHYATSCAISCRMIFRAITDSLFLADSDGDLVGYLVDPDSITASDDAKVWSFAVREGISFHDGTPLDGAAAAYNIDVCRASPVRGAQFAEVADVTSEGQTVTMTYRNSAAIGPRDLLRAETCGYMFSPTWIKTLASNPLLTEEEVAAADGDPSEPVGLGAFMYESYTPGNGNSFVAVRNPDYWRGANGITGENLPYLDEIEFVVAVDIQARSNGLKSGEFDIIHTANADEIAKYQDGDDDFTVIAADENGQTGYILLNVAQGDNPRLAADRGLDELPMDPNGLNVDNPLIHLTCRRALAHAIDQDRYAIERGAGIVQAANGPFAPGSIGFLDETGYPQYDLDAARANFENCKADSGQNPVTFTFNTTNDAFNVESNELIAAMWREAFGDEISASISPIEQGQYIGIAFVGAYQAQGWRNHGGIDPAGQSQWWHSLSSEPMDPANQLRARNFGRFVDPEIDAALDIINTNQNQAARVEAAEEISRLFGENVWNLWLTWTVWGIIANPRVQDITVTTIPGNPELASPVITGKHGLADVWCLDGEC